MGINPQPVELTPKQRRRQNLHKFFSPMCHRLVELESFNEFSTWLSHEFNPEIDFLCERPAQLVAYVDGREQGYTPDLFARTANGDEYLGECKQAADLVEDETGVLVPKRWPVISAITERYNLTLRVFTDIDLLDQQIALSNWRTALPYVSDEAQRPRRELRRQVMAQFDLSPRQSFFELATNCPDWEPTEVHSAAIWSVHQRLLSLDWNAAPLGEDTLLTAGTGAPRTSR